MKIMRAKKSFRIAAKSIGGGRRGFDEGDLVPDSHPQIKKFSAYFEPVEDFVARQYPELSGGKKRGKLFGRPDETQPETPPIPEPSEPPVSETGPVRPPSSGPGSGVEAWRAYAAKVTDSPAESWESLTRDEIIELLDSEGADSGQE